MMDPLVNPLVIDAFEFCRLVEMRQGEIAIADLPRLAADVASTAGVMRWAIEGDLDELGHARLRLAISGTVQLKCQRCLAPYAFELKSDSMLVLAKDEAVADHIEALLDNDEIDVIVVGKTLDVRDLIEDEALLALPSSPRHGECPPLALAEVPLAADKAGSPFDVLKNWKR